MRNLDGKWTISRDAENFNEYEYFDTKEEAVEFGEIYSEFEGEDFYVAQIEGIDINSGGLGDEVIELIQNRHWDNDGEFAEDYLYDVKEVHIKELDEALKKVVDEWATKFEYQPTFYNIRNLERIEMEL